MTRDPDFERRVSENARNFEVGALLDLLESRDYDQVRFRSEWTRGFRASRITSIDFDDPRENWVTVVVNLGLLSNQSPLPDYFGRILDRNVTDGSFAEFLGAIDHPLLKQRFEAARGRASRWLLPGWRGIERSFLGVMDVRSAATMDSIMRRAFPELGVVLTLGSEDSRIRVPSVITNHSRFGRSAFGGAALADVSGLSVRLISEDTNTENGERWEEVAAQRIKDWVLPVVQGSGITLLVTLEIEEPPKWVDLSGDSRIGYDRLRSRDRGEVRDTVLFRDWLSGPVEDDGRVRA